MFSKQLKQAMQEAQKVTPALALPNEEQPTKPGAFKVSSKILKAWREQGGMGKPSDLLFRKVRDFIESIPREDLPKYFGIKGGGAKGISDTQDFIANKPRNAFQKWLQLSAKVNQRLAKYLREIPENAPLIYYMFMDRISGHDIAKITFKRYFETESGHPGAAMAAFKKSKVGKRAQAAAEGE